MSRRGRGVVQLALQFGLIGGSPVDRLRCVIDGGFMVTGAGGGVEARGGEAGRRSSSESNVSLRTTIICESECDVSLSVKLETDPLL